ncbi:MAG: hypothetical protein NTY02_19000 [Acidobacteria bacterium]|nr:hypothetical protein [Acidobacteriota bacterium]
MSEAASLHDAARVSRLIRERHNPNVRWPVRPGIVDDRGLDLLPIDAAVGSRRLEIVRLLMAQGVRLDDDARHRLICIAKLNGSGDIVAFFQAGGPQPPGEPRCEGVVALW